ncbi:MAG TPA: phosphoglycerate mutase family protein [Candidatus Eisenbacteria bacterium]
MARAARLFATLSLVLGTCAPAFLPTAARAETTVFVVRHAEKVDSSEDPDLDATGRERARLLRDMLRDIPIDSIYSSRYQRALQTVLPTAQLKEQMPVIHTTERIASITAALRSSAADSVDRYVLAAGHSNTVILWLKGLGIDSIAELMDHEWDNLFIVTIGDGGRSRLLRLHYGY